MLSEGAADVRCSRGREILYKEACVSSRSSSEGTEWYQQDAALEKMAGLKGEGTCNGRQSLLLGR